MLRFEFPPVRGELGPIAWVHRALRCNASYTPTRAGRRHAPFVCTSPPFRLSLPPQALAPAHGQTYSCWLRSRLAQPLYPLAGLQAGFLGYITGFMVLKPLYNSPFTSITPPSPGCAVKLAPGPCPMALAGWRRWRAVPGSRTPHCQLHSTPSLLCPAAVPDTQQPASRPSPTRAPPFRHTRHPCEQVASRPAVACGFDLICNAQRRVSTRPSHAPASSRLVECT